MMVTGWMLLPSQAQLSPKSKNYYRSLLGWKRLRQARAPLSPAHLFQLSVQVSVASHLEGRCGIERYCGMQRPWTPVQCLEAVFMMFLKPFTNAFAIGG